MLLCTVIRALALFTDISALHWRSRCIPSRLSGSQVLPSTFRYILCASPETEASLKSKVPCRGTTPIRSISVSSALEAQRRPPKKSGKNNEGDVVEGIGAEHPNPKTRPRVRTGRGHRRGRKKGAERGLGPGLVSGADAGDQAHRVRS